MFMSVNYTGLYVITIARSCWTELFEIIKRYNITPFPDMMSNSAFYPYGVTLTMKKESVPYKIADVVCCASK